MARPEYFRFTREQLYELVWSKPLTEIACEFGMSSNAFAKYCKAADVPRPERGYWQQFASGQKPKPAVLPKAHTDRDVVIPKYAGQIVGPRRAPSGLDRIQVPERIVRYHLLAKELDVLLREDFRHGPLLAVRGFSQVVYKLAEASRRRAMRFLHTLFAHIERRGHQVRLRKPSDPTAWNADRCALEVIIDGEVVEVSLREHMNQKHHDKTERETAWGFGRTHDLVASGILILELRIPWPTATRTRWRDAENRTLEDCLAEIVWVFDEARERLGTHRALLAERAGGRASAPTRRRRTSRTAA